MGQHHGALDAASRQYRFSNSMHSTTHA
jgi:hypothetical protein